MKTCRRGLHQYSGRRCVECKSVRSVELYKENPGKRKAYHAALYASDPEKVKDRSARWAKEHPESGRARTAKWRKAHPERANAWAMSHPLARRAMKHHRRASATNNPGTEPITALHLSLLFTAQDGCCRYCRETLGPNKHLDHRIPLIRGGPHAPHNVCWSCPTCNLRKGTLTEIEYIEKGAAIGTNL